MPVKKNRRIHGEGTIRRKRENLWEARYTTGYDENGRQIQKSVYGVKPCFQASAPLASKCKCKWKL